MAIKGLSNTTSKKLNEYTEKPKKKELTTVEEPEAYSSEYSDKQKELLSSYLDREPYEFNINTDKLYNQYADSYKKQGNAAMRDTLADAASKTGGYTSSYGVTAGSQAYQGYLDKLNDIVPQLEANAYQRYLSEGEGIRDRIELLSQLDSTAYDRHRDDVDDYRDIRDYYKSVYEYDNDYELDVYKTLTDYILDVSKLENEDYKDTRNYNRAAYEYDTDLAYKKEQDKRAAYEYDTDLAYKKEQDKRAAYEYDTDLAYKKEQDKRAAYEYDSDLAYKKEQDKRAAYEYDSDLAYKKEQDKRAAYEYDSDRELDVYKLLTSYILDLPDVGYNYTDYNGWFYKLLGLK